MSMKSVALGAALSLLMVCGSALGAGAAQAASPAWSVTSTASPTAFAPGDDSGLSYYIVRVTNIGGASTDGSTITITDNLPSSIVVDATPQGFRTLGIDDDSEYEPVGATCDAGPPVTCVVPGAAVRPDRGFIVRIPVNIAADAPATVDNHVTVSGGGAPSASGTEATRVTTEPTTFGFQRLTTRITDADGFPDTRAGTHPYVFHTDFQLNTVYDTQSFLNTPVETPKDVVAKLPVGMVLNPKATAVRCTESQLERNACPDASAVGIVHTTIGPAGFADSITDNALYNMVPPPGRPASLGFDAASLNIFVHLLGGVDTAGNYALTADTRDILEYGSISGIAVDLWGNPSDPSHDYRRGACSIAGAASIDRQCPTEAVDTPLLSLPSACSGPLTTTISVASWINRDRFITGTSQTSEPTGVTGCEALDFTPSIAVKPDTSVADAPAGLDVDLRVPQTDSQGALATANLKDAKVTLPAGMSVSPSAADGLAACSPAQLGLRDAGAVACPEASKIGTVSLTTPLLDDPLQGGIYLAAQNDNPARSVLGLYVTAEGVGVRIKLFGHVQADPATGRLTATFENNPQLPFSDLALHFKGGARAPLATPDACGSYTTDSLLAPWSGTAPVALRDGFSIASGCVGGLAPAFAAGVTNPSAAKSTDFTLRVARSDGQQHLRSITTTLAPGVLANVGSVPLCGDGDAAAGTCPAASRVGTTDVAAGPGSAPFHVAGQVFLTGPHKGGPYGLSIVTRALAGPFDLGTVVVRAAIKVDPIDAHVTVVSDDVPNVLTVRGADGDANGFPLRIRSIDVDMNRSGFMVNPTSCAPMSIGATLGSWEGATATASSRFQLGGCAALAVAPKLALSLTGTGQTTDGKHPGVDAVLTQTPGLSNLKRVKVTLPLSLALDPDHAQALCEFADGSKVDPVCPKGSVVGHATAQSPILDGPLTGPVYFVKNVRKDPKSGREIKTLPKLVIPMTGPNGLRLNLTGLSSVPDNEHLVTTFDLLPDAPVSKFALTIDGGAHGILTVSGTDVCKATQKATQEVDGQNGRSSDTSITIATPACKLRILSKSITKTRVTVKVGGLGAGKVTLSGAGLKKSSRTLAGSTVATITARRTRGKLGKVTVAFDPTGPAKARKVTK